MRIFIKEWPNKTASIMTAEGQVIWTFSSSNVAQQACREWRSLISPENIESLDTATADSTSFSCLT